LLIWEKKVPCNQEVQEPSVLKMYIACHATTTTIRKDGCLASRNEGMVKRDYGLPGEYGTNLIGGRVHGGV
jgi:hypothetical protein